MTNSPVNPNKFTEEQFNFRYSDPDRTIRLLNGVLNAGLVDFEGYVQMDSGRELLIDIDPSEPALRIGDGPYYFDITYEEVDGKRAVNPRVDVMNREGFNRHHPDFFAGRLLTRSIAFVEEKFASGPIERMVGEWRKGPLNDNYIQYIQGLTVGLSEQEAAFSTPNGRHALKNGFEEIGLISYEKQGMLIYFDRV